MKVYKQEEEDSLKNQLNEDEAIYGHSAAREEARLREAINRTPAEKFQFLMTLMKMNNTMRRAVIHHKKGY
jgi:hypothetical protein